MVIDLPKSTVDVLEYKLSRLTPSINTPNACIDDSDKVSIFRLDLAEEIEAVICDYIDETYNNNGIDHYKDAIEYSLMLLIETHVILMVNSHNDGIEKDLSMVIYKLFKTDGAYGRVNPYTKDNIGIETIKNFFKENLVNSTIVKTLLNLRSTEIILKRINGVMSTNSKPDNEIPILAVVGWKNKNLYVGISLFILPF